ncbi:hypothetical protein CPB84DRAFT_1745599 [Gymnopilus junonius]|uniref:Uncharacterized protein n=1 Tax=Gymnopilus junonius TaxID=109634 RepID=A0A9P5NQ76_GYMJU|nr:hypothetical protein CPB84DRAFT_1745599 [Gymnopilus junonius]
MCHHLQIGPFVKEPSEIMEISRSVVNTFVCEECGGAVVEALSRLLWVKEETRREGGDIEGRERTIHHLLIRKLWMDDYLWDTSFLTTREIGCSAVFWEHQLEVRKGAGMSEAESAEKSGQILILRGVIKHMWSDLVKKEGSGGWCQQNQSTRLVLEHRGVTGRGNSDQLGRRGRRCSDGIVWRDNYLHLALPYEGGGSASE